MFIVKLDKRKKEPYYKQITSSIKEGIIEGRIKDVDRMPKMEDAPIIFIFQRLLSNSRTSSFQKKGF